MIWRGILYLLYFIQTNLMYYNVYCNNTIVIDYGILRYTFNLLNFRLMSSDYSVVIFPNCKVLTGC